MNAGKVRQCEWWHLRGGLSVGERERGGGCQQKLELGIVNVVGQWVGQMGGFGKLDILADDTGRKVKDARDLAVRQVCGVLEA